MRSSRLLAIISRVQISDVTNIRPPSPSLQRVFVAADKIPFANRPHVLCRVLVPVNKCDTIATCLF